MSTKNKTIADCRETVENLEKRIEDMRIDFSSEKKNLHKKYKKAIESLMETCEKLELELFNRKENESFLTGELARKALTIARLESSLAHSDALRAEQYSVIEKYREDAENLFLLAIKKKYTIL